MINVHYMFFVRYLEVTTGILLVALLVLAYSLLKHWRKNDLYDWLSTSFILGEVLVLGYAWFKRDVKHDPTPDVWTMIFWTFLVLVSVGMTFGVVYRDVHRKHWRSYDKRPEADQIDGPVPGRPTDSP